MRHPERLLERLRRERSFVFFLLFYFFLISFLLSVYIIYVIRSGEGFYDVSLVSIVFLFLFSFGFVKSLDYYRVLRNEYKKREKGLVVGIRSEKEIEDFLLSLDFRRYVCFKNIEFSVGDRVFDVDFLVFDKEKNECFLIEVKGYSGKIFVDEKGCIYVNGIRKNCHSFRLVSMVFKYLKKNPDFFVSNFGVSRVYIHSVFVFPSSFSVSFSDKIKGIKFYNKTDFFKLFANR